MRVQRDAVTAYVALGANLGDAVLAVRHAMGALGNAPAIFFDLAGIASGFVHGGRRPRPGD